MKKLLTILLLVAQPLWAIDYETDKSTNSLSSATTSVLPLSGPGDILGSLLINQRSSAPCTFTIYDSSGQVNGSFGVIDISTGTYSSINTENQYRYNIRISSAITFTKSSACGDVTILWKNVR